MTILKWYVIAECIMCIFIEFRALKHEELSLGGFILALLIFIPMLIYATAN